jgi:hypothetical protein
VVRAGQVPRLRHRAEHTPHHGAQGLLHDVVIGDEDIPQRLVERFPDEMTIVLQNRFWDLTVDENRFSVVAAVLDRLGDRLVILGRAMRIGIALGIVGDMEAQITSFNQVPSKLVIPYSAITRFQDPEVQFELGFHVGLYQRAGRVLRSLTSCA